MLNFSKPCSAGWGTTAHDLRVLRAGRNCAQAEDGQLGLPTCSVQAKYSYAWGNIKIRTFLGSPCSRNILPFDALTLFPRFVHRPEG